MPHLTLLLRRAFNRFAISFLKYSFPSASLKSFLDFESLLTATSKFPWPLSVRVHQEFCLGHFSFSSHSPSMTVTTPLTLSIIYMPTT